MYQNENRKAILRKRGGRTPNHRTLPTTEDLHMENKKSESELDVEIVFEASTDEDAQIDDTLPWEDLRLQALEESHLAPETVIIISGSNIRAPSVIDINSETTREDDLPDQILDEPQSDPPTRTTMGENDLLALGVDVPQPVTLIVRRGHCLTDLISAFKNPNIMSTALTIKMRLPNGELEEGEGSGVFQDCLFEFWTDFYMCTLEWMQKYPLLGMTINMRRGRQ